MPMADFVAQFNKGATGKYRRLTRHRYPAPDSSTAGARSFWERFGEPRFIWGIFAAQADTE